MSESVEHLQRIRTLFQEERQQALLHAQEVVRASYGSPPTLEQFAFAAPSKYPAWVNIGVFGLCIIVLLAAFATSAMRLNYIGRESFFSGLPDATSAIAAGIATVILAEATQMIATLALAIITEPTMRFALHLTAALATCIAVVGNVAVAKPTNPIGNWLTWDLLFAWLEAVAPPLITLATVHVLKHQALDAITRQHEAKHQYELALANWQLQTSADPHLHPRWMEFHMNALQDAIRRANSTVPKAFWNTLHRRDWVYLLRRELAASELHQDVQAALQTQPVEALQAAPAEDASMSVEVVQAKQPGQSKQKQSGGGGGHATGEVEHAMQTAAATDGGFKVACPVCSAAFERATELGATRALSAHMKKHVNEQKQTVMPDVRQTAMQSASVGTLAGSVNGSGE